MAQPIVMLCPGQGAQVVGMGRAWAEACPAGAEVFQEADAVLADRLGAPLSQICFDGPVERVNQTDVSQPALYTAAVASYRALRASELAVDEFPLAATAGLSLGEYTALHLAGVFSFAEGLELVAQRGRFMQEAAEASQGSMVALIGADEDQAQAICEQASQGEELVCANYNAPGQIVLSGTKTACDRAVTVAGEMGLRAQALVVAGAFHSELMRPAAERMAEALERITFQPPSCPVFSNVTAGIHDSSDPDSIRRLLVDQITSPVKWSQSCAQLSDTIEGAYHELAPGKVLSGLMRRINRQIKVVNHDQP